MMLNESALYPSVFFHCVKTLRGSGTPGLPGSKGLVSAPGDVCAHVCVHVFLCVCVCVCVFVWSLNAPLMDGKVSIRTCQGAVQPQGAQTRSLLKGYQFCLRGSMGDWETEGGWEGEMEVERKRGENWRGYGGKNNGC